MSPCCCCRCLSACGRKNLEADDEDGGSDLATSVLGGSDLALVVVASGGGRGEVALEKGWEGFFSEGSFFFFKASRGWILREEEGDSRVRLLALRNLEKRNFFFKKKYFFRKEKQYCLRTC